MRIVHISWEYPPLVYGGLGRHVGALATAQARAGHDVTVITQTEAHPVDERLDGVRVVRHPRDPADLEFRADTMLRWVTGLNRALESGVERVAADGPVDVIHGHDWMVTRPVATAQLAMHAPVVATLHATEAGRHQGWLPNEISRAVHSAEWDLAHRATRVIACSAAMGSEVRRLFRLPAESVVVIPNGIDLAQWRVDDHARAEARRTYAGSGPLIVFAGRIEWEKGVHALIDAMRQVSRVDPTARLVVAGRGGREAALRTQAAESGLGETVHFTGWLPESELHALVAAADVAVVPSLYEPFGLVALEAAALGTPLVVARTGGLAEIADEGRVAMTFTPDDPSDLTRVLVRTLADPEAAASRARAARADLETVYNWELIAAQTVAAYESAAASWDGRTGPSPAPVIGSGNLLAVGPSAD
ncbi:MAG: glycosyltransferase family 4 protein [Candidatus Nanopelagicales bacterium]